MTASGWNLRRSIAVVIVLWFLAVLAPNAPVAAQSPASHGPYQGIEVSMGPFDADLSDPAMAINYPDAYAWQLFCALNRQAELESTDVIWQRWIEELNVYADPTRVPLWDEATNREFVASPAFAHISREGAVEQVKNNRVLFDSIVEKSLWYQEGLLEAAENGLIRFPIQSKTVKALWRPLREDEDPTRYVLATEHFVSEATDYGTGIKRTPIDPPRTMVLAGFSIVTKDLPNWFWAVWEHVDQPGRNDITGALDTFGTKPAFSPPNGRHQVYPAEKLTPALTEMFDTNGIRGALRNYRLKGTQVSFVDATGRPTILASSVQEIGQVATSSCITCHARASVNHGVAVRGLPQEQLDGSKPLHLEFLQPPKSLLNPRTGYAGAPDPDWFFQRHSGVGNGLPIVFQVDFLWQLPFQTKPRQGFNPSPEPSESSAER